MQAPGGRFEIVDQTAGKGSFKELLQEDSLLFPVAVQQNFSLKRHFHFETDPLTGVGHLIGIALGLCDLVV